MYCIELSQLQRFFFQNDQSFSSVTRQWTSRILSITLQEAQRLLETNLLKKLLEHSSVGKKNSKWDGKFYVEC